MNLYCLVPLLSALVCMATGLLVLAREPSATTHRCLAALLLGATFWGVCEALWTLAPEAETALLLVRISSVGWIAVGPLCMHLFLASARGMHAGLWRVLPVAYALAGAAWILEWITPWMHAGVSPVPWGWAYTPGPAYAAWYAGTVLSSSAGIRAAVRDLERSPSPADVRQAPWLRASVSVPLFVGSASDGLLPLLGIEVPRVGVASFAVFGALVLLSIRRFGWSLVAPGSFANDILAAMTEGVALAAPDGRVRVANPRLGAMLGVPASALVDRPVRTFLPDVELPADAALGELETELETRGGGRLPVALSVAPLRDRQETPIGVVLVLRDLREVASLRARLLTSARLAAVGELAAGIAHEINNPLAWIGSNLRALREQWQALAKDDAAGAPREALAEGLELLDDSLEGVERAAAIVRDVRAFSHGGGETREPLDPVELLERVLRVAEPQLRHRVRVEREYAANGPLVGARRELEQVFLNLVVNAAQAIEGPGTIRVGTRADAGELEIRVADDGRGIPRAVLARIFDPFFTTKPVGEGTGLGLSISHEIVRRHGGRIDVVSEPGRGTEVRVRLPRAPGDGSA